MMNRMQELETYYQRIENIVKEMEKMTLDLNREIIYNKSKELLQAVKNREYLDSVNYLFPGTHRKYCNMLSFLITKLREGQYKTEFSFEMLDGRNFPIRPEPRFEVYRNKSQQMTIEKSLEIDKVLHTIFYKDGRPSPPAFSNANSSMQFPKRITLEKNLALRIVAALPHGNPYDPNDPDTIAVPGLSPVNYNDGRSPTTKVSALNAIIFVGGVAAEVFRTSESGGHFGDIVFSYIQNDQGTIIEWNMHTVSFGAGTKYRDYTMTEKSAFAYLDENREELIQEWKL
jgi:hypothetical protein